MPDFLATFIAKLMTYGIVAVGLGLNGAIFLTPIFLLLRFIFYVPLKQDKYIAIAKQKGHVLKATLDKEYSEKESSSSGRMIATGRRVGIYKYECNGRIRKYKAVSTYQLPETITLYYLKNPKKAATAGYVALSEAPWFSIYMKIAFILMIVILLAGMILG